MSLKLGYKTYLTINERNILQRLVNIQIKNIKTEIQFNTNLNNFKKLIYETELKQLTKINEKLEELS